MINIYFLPVLIIASVVFICIGIVRAIKGGPIKIKIFSIILLSLALCHYVSLMLLIFFQSILLLYTLKPLFYLNYLYIPCMAVTAAYIILRVQHIKFIKIIYIFIGLVFTYIYIIIAFPNNIILYRDYGYVMYLQNNKAIFVAIFLLNLSLLILGVKVLYKKNKDIFGNYLIVTSAIATIYEISTVFLSKSLFQENLISDFLWIVTLVYSINKLKSREN